MRTHCSLIASHCSLFRAKMAQFLSPGGGTQTELVSCSLAIRSTFHLLASLDSSALDRCARCSSTVSWSLCSPHLFRSPPTKNVLVLAAKTHVFEREGKGRREVPDASSSEKRRAKDGRFSNRTNQRNRWMTMLFSASSSLSTTDQTLRTRA